MEIYQFVFLMAMLACMFAFLFVWLYLLSCIGNSTLLVLQEVNDRLPERELDGLGHGAEHGCEDEARYAEADSYGDGQPADAVGAS